LLALSTGNIVLERRLFPNYRGNIGHNSADGPVGIREAESVD
jgi:hypothetical protein